MSRILFKVTNCKISVHFKLLFCNFYDIKLFCIIFKQINLHMFKSYILNGITVQKSFTISSIFLRYNYIKLKKFLFVTHCPFFLCLLFCLYRSCSLAICISCACYTDYNSPQKSCAVLKNYKKSKNRYFPEKQIRKQSKCVSINSTV